MARKPKTPGPEPVTPELKEETPGSQGETPGLNPEPKQSEKPKVTVLQPNPYK